MLLLLLVGVLSMLDWTSSCDIKAKGVDEKVKARILKKHNELRSKIATGGQKGYPKASNMLELVWDDAIAGTAQKWAEQCKFEHDPGENRKVGSEYVGQNIAQETGSADWEGMIQRLYDEVNLYTPAGIKNFKFGLKTDHFTQVVWAETSKVGCGYVLYNKSTHYFVCNYAPGGNMQGSSVYKEGEPCSDCGGCGSIKGLCSSKGGGGGKDSKKGG